MLLLEHLSIKTCWYLLSLGVQILISICDLFCAQRAGGRVHVRFSAVRAYLSTNKSLPRQVQIGTMKCVIAYICMYVFQVR